MRLNRRTFAGGASFALALTAVTGGSSFAQATPQASPVAGTTREIVHPQGTTQVPVDPQRIINLGDEWLLADLLELGVTPIASSATYASGFVGIDPAYSPEIGPFTVFELDIESLVALAPDLIVIPDYLFGYVEGLYENLSMLAPVVSVPDTDVWQENYLTLAAIFGKEAEAAETIATLEAEIADTAASLNLAGRTASVATVYPGGDGFALWVSNANPIVDLLMTLGVEVLPDASEYDVDDTGRAWMSLEEVGVVQGETLIMLQTFSVEAEGEQEGFDLVTGSELWQTIPAVQNNRVFILERVGFPGEIPGRRNVLAKYVDIFG